MDFKNKKFRSGLFLIAFGVILMWGLENLSIVKNIISSIFAILKPFIMAIVIAFLFNGPMSSIEKRLDNIDGLKRQHKRVISYIITLVLFILIIGIISFIIVPELINTSKQLAKDFPKYWDNIQSMIISNPNIQGTIADIDFDSIYDTVYNFFKNGLVNWIGSTLSVVSRIVSGLVSFVISFMLSIYLLMDKEGLSLSLKRLLYAIMSKERVERLIELEKLTKKTFNNFINGQLMESTILALMFFITMIIFKMPYASMISVVIGVTSLIPTVGSFIGCGVGLLLISVVDIRKALLFLIVFLIIQQIEGNLIYPRVVGKASGLSSIWVLIAITLGGNLMGILGIVLFVPLFSIGNVLLKEFVDKRLKNKNIDI